MKLLILIAIILLWAVPVYATAPQDLGRAITRSVVYLRRNITDPQVSSVGGEWAVIGLARSGRNVPDSFFARYLLNVENHLVANDGVLDARRLTEYSRVVLALTAIGENPQNFAGFDLTMPLANFDRTVWQGINGAIFALLAFDSLDYVIPTNQNANVQSTRQLFIEEILSRQNEDGGWSLIGDSDPDITAMALQALAKYVDDMYVYSAVEGGLVFLSDVQNEQGGFHGGLGGAYASVESAVQVLVALTELGISLDDPRFVKNGNTVLDNVLSFQMPDGSFRHTYNTGRNMMATEIGLYGLVAAQRSFDGLNSLYRMDDRTLR